MGKAVNSKAVFGIDVIMKYKVLLVGYHGKHNLGDDIFRRVLIDAISCHTAISTVWILAANQVGTVDQTPLGLEVRWLKNPNWLPGRLRWLSVLVHSFKVHGIIFGAGTLFKNQGFDEIYKVLRMREKVVGQPFYKVACGVSVGPFSSQKKQSACFRLLSCFDNVLLRDEISEVRLTEAQTDTQNISFTTGFDLALGLTEYPAVKRADPEGVIIIGISVTPRAFPEWKDVDVKFGEFCESLIKLGNNARTIVFRILVACTDPKDGDQAISSQLEKTLKAAGCATEVIMHNDSSLDDTFQKIGSCTALIASRMHVGIVGLIYRIPVFQISYEEKISAFYKRHNLSTNLLLKSDELNQTVLQSKLKSIVDCSEEKYASISEVHLRDCREAIKIHLEKSLNDFAKNRNV